MTTVRGERESASELRSLIALEQEAADLDASRALGVLRRRWPVVVLVPLLFAAFGFGWSARRDKVYESSAYVVVRPTAADAQFATKYAGMLTVRSVTSVAPALPVNAAPLPSEGRSVDCPI